jgi:hypothetical protein
MWLVDKVLSEGIWSTDYCRRVLNFEFQTIQLLNLGSEPEGDSYKTTSENVRVKAKIFKLDHTK